ncbi:response regulator [Litoribacter ruber]|uniref:PAS domain-containing hybrid sensor histidine kinase/response regulator n=1 Tax=Litoribacter ruber TaxID=702568 RepID=UPI001BD91862|nr:PAS domain-containing hybrid sensor histidine kinase/response regulator [Litoribacter ruber]MBT0811289.1 response regulator [Litoribacter ruber]
MAKSTSWVDILSDLLRFSLEQKRLVPSHQALKAVLIKTGQIVKASHSYFIRVDSDNNNFIEIYSSEPDLSVPFEVIKDWQKDIATFKKLQKSEKKGGFNKLNHLLIIPIEENSYAVFGFQLSPEGKEKIMNLVNLIQPILYDILHEIKSKNDLLQIAQPLHNSQAAVVEYSTDLVFTLDEQQSFTTLNPNFIKYLSSETGEKPELGDELPSEISALFGPNFPNLIGKSFKGLNFSKELPIKWAKKKVYYEFSFYPIRYMNNKVVEISVVGHDITKRKKSEYLVRQQSQLLNSILENLPVIIFRISEIGYFLEFSGAGINKLGLNRDEVIGQKALKVFPELREPIQKMKRKNPSKFTLEGEKNGIHWVFEAFTFQDETSPKDIVGFAFDITEQFIYKKELQLAKESAESASLAKSSFLANQSHEIRTPINTMLGFAQLIKNHPLPKETEEYLDYIISSGKILLSLLGNVLDLTKIEEGKIELQEEAFHLKETITSNVYPYKFQAKEKGLKFTLQFGDNIPNYLIGDSQKIVQIIINLISNSLKFTKQGEIHISFKCMYKTHDQNIFILIEVSDTGIGIPKSKQDTIFENYTQADSSINREFGGFGLGLSIVRKLINLMGGEIGVQSPGKLVNDSGPCGSTFWIHLPLQITETQNTQDINTESSQIHYNREAKVLLVDDNYLNQRLGAAMLDGIGCSVVLANNGKEALTLVLKENFDLILMDVQMPVLNGFETTRRIREHNSHVPIIGLSANVYKEDIEHCFRAGMNDYLGRPFTKKSFQDKVVKWVPQNLHINRPQRITSQNLTGLAFLEQVFNGDQEIIIEIVEDYLHHHDIMIAELHDTLANENYSMAASILHKIRSSLQTVGLNSLYKTLTDMEQIAKNEGNGKKLKVLFEEVRITSEIAKKELEESLILLRKN